MKLLLLGTIITTFISTITPASPIQTETGVYYDYLVVEVDGTDYLLDDCANSPYLNEKGIPLFENGQEVEVAFENVNGNRVVHAVDGIKQEHAELKLNTVSINLDTLSKDKQDEYILNRKGTLLITRQTGTVIDDDKNGETKDGDYISYKRVEDAKKGDKIVTVFVWNPNNNYLDGIDARYDYISN